MLSRNLLLEHYKEIFNQNSSSFNHAIITNENAIEEGILLMGLNPSGNPFGETPDDRESIEYYGEKGCHGKYWDPKHEMMGCYDKKCAYLDLLPIRDGNQDHIKKYNEEYNELIGQLISETQDYIESLKPKLIIYANSLDFYWGCFGRKKQTDDGFWMDYIFEKVGDKPLKGDKSCWPFYKIIGINPSGVNKQRSITELQGTFFLRYRQHKTKYGSVPINKKLTQEDIKVLVEWIDSVWAKSLL